MRDPQQARDGVAATVERFGGLDILVNNAAAWSVDLFKNLTYEQYQLDVGVTLIGTMVMTKAAYDHMREQNSGTVVNLISDAGRIGEPFLVSYSAAKGGSSVYEGLRQRSRSLRNPVQRGVAGHHQDARRQPADHKMGW